MVIGYFLSIIHILFYQPSSLMAQWARASRVEEFELLLEKTHDAQSTPLESDLSAQLPYHSTKKPVTTMLTYPWKCTVLHCNHLGNTWKPLVLMT